MTTLLYIFFPLLCIGSIPNGEHLKGPVRRFIFGIALYETLLLAIGLGLGHSHRLSSYNYLVVTVCVAAVLMSLTLRHGISVRARNAMRWARTLRGATATFLLSLLALVLLTQLAYDFTFGTRHYDGLWYHIPRVMFWLQQGSFDAWITSSWQQIGLPVGADLVLGQKVLLGSGWAGTGLVTGVLTLGAAGCLYDIARYFRLTRWHAILAALLFCSFPAIGQRFWTLSSDMAAAFPLLAAFVAMTRISNIAGALGAFLVLNGVAIACKPTIVPHALILGGVSLWCNRRRLRDFASAPGRVSPFLLGGAALCGLLFVLGSFWPVYQTFLDFQGGDGGRMHKVGSVGESLQAISLSTAHWLVDPLGFFPPDSFPWAKKVVVEVYRWFGVGSALFDDSWLPAPSQDVGHSGLAMVLALPALLAGLAPIVRWKAGSLFFLGFISLSGMIRFMPWNPRFAVVLLAGFALLWAGTGLFRRGWRRWVLAALVAVNLCALFGVTLLIMHRDRTIHSRPGGYYHYITEADRKTVATDLGGRPLLVLTFASMDALLVGLRIEFPLEYLICPSDGDWTRELLDAASRSNWLALVHQGRTSLQAGPDYHRPGLHVCSEVAVPDLENSLRRAGWLLYRQDTLVDLWRHPHPSGSVSQKMPPTS